MMTYEEWTLMGSEQRISKLIQMDANIDYHERSRGEAEEKIKVMEARCEELERVVIAVRDGMEVYPQWVKPVEVPKAKEESKKTYCAQCGVPLKTGEDSLCTDCWCVSEDLNQAKGEPINGTCEMCGTPIKGLGVCDRCWDETENDRQEEETDDDAEEDQTESSEAGGNVPANGEAQALQAMVEPERDHGSSPVVPAQEGLPGPASTQGGGEVIPHPMDRPVTFHPYPETEPPVGRRIMVIGYTGNLGMDEYYGEHSWCWHRPSAVMYWADCIKVGCVTEAHRNTLLHMKIEHEKQEWQKYVNKVRGIQTPQPSVESEW